MKRFLALLLVCCLLPLCALAENVIVDLVNHPDTPYQLDETAPLLEVFFPMIYGSDACFLRCGGQVAMVDGSTVGQRDRVQTCMEAFGLSSIDWALNTHPHNDHLPGMVKVAERVPVKQFYRAFPADYDAQMKLGMSELNKLGVPVSQVRDGDVLTLGEAALTVIQRDGPQFTTNDRSAMLLVQLGERRLLLTADVENRAQAALAETDPPACGLDCDILKYPHHGQTPLRKAFLAATHPQATVITNNFYDGGPGALQVQGTGAPAFSTIYGVLRLRTDGKIWVIDYPPETLRRMPPEKIVYGT